MVALSITEDSEAFLALKGFVERLDNPVPECEGEEETEAPNTQLILASPTASLRKITLNLAGSLPSVDHHRRVQNGGEKRLREVVWELLQGSEQGYTQNSRRAGCRSFNADLE